MEPNFIIIPQTDPLAVLWKAFPELQSELDDDLGPYYVYTQFAAYLALHRNDQQLWLRGAAFFESLAADCTLQDILVIGLFEPMCDDPDLVAKLRDIIGPSSRRLIEASELLGPIRSSRP